MANISPFVHQCHIGALHRTANLLVPSLVNVSINGQVNLKLEIKILIIRLAWRVHLVVVCSWISVVNGVYESAHSANL